MNTSFKILWFEDELTWFNMERMRVNAILQKHYLTSDINRKDGGDVSLSELTKQDYDLILMDYKLAEGTTGDTIAVALRDCNVLTDILFYSSEEQNMISAIMEQNPPIDGVYLTKRDYKIFTDKVEKLIEKIVRRSEDVVNLRGFVLDNTSDFEVRIREILSTCWDKFGEDQRKSLTEKVISLLDSKIAYVRKNVERAKAAPCCFSHANNDEYTLTIADRLEIMQVILSILLQEYNMPGDTCPKDFKNDYKDKVNIYRNRLSHLALGEKTIRIKNQDVEINQKLHRLMRKNISEIDSVIVSLESFITAMR